METRSLLFTRGPVPEGRFAIPLGVADVKRPGSDVTMITWGWQVPEALAAAETLAAEGTDVEVVDLRTLVPLDLAAILESVAKTKRLLIVHAATQFAGPGAEIAAIVSATSSSASWRRRWSGWGRSTRRSPTPPSSRSLHFPERARIVDADPLDGVSGP